MTLKKFRIDENDNIEKVRKDTYHCSKCQKEHEFNSKKGREHLEYKNTNKFKGFKGNPNADKQYKDN